MIRHLNTKKTYKLHRNCVLATQLVIPVCVEKAYGGVEVHMHAFLTLKFTWDQWPATWPGWVDHQAQLDVFYNALLLYTRHNTTWAILPLASPMQNMFSLTGNNFGQVGVILHIEIYCASNNGYVQIILVYILLHTIPCMATLSVICLVGTMFIISFLQCWLLLPCSQWNVFLLVGHNTQYSWNGCHNYKWCRCMASAQPTPYCF